MTADERNEIYKGLDEKMIALTNSKSHDYADADVLNNFKKVSAAAKELDVDVSTPDGYALFMVILKIARLGNLMKDSKVPNNESIDDSFMDGINYFKLAYCCYLDRVNNPKNE